MIWIGVLVGGLAAAANLVLLKFSVGLAISMVAPRDDKANPAPKLGTFFLLLFSLAKLAAIGILSLYFARGSDAARTGFLIGFGLVYSVVVGAVAVRGTRL